MTEQEVFVLADWTLKGVVDQITDEQWEMVMPDSFMTRDKKPVTLREVINYHAYDDAWVPDMLAGRTMQEVGEDAFKGDLLGETPKENFAAIVEAACKAAEELEDPNIQVHCSFGDYTAQEYLWQINSFRGLRAYDISKAMGVDPTLPEALVQGLWEELEPHAEEWRALGVFGPKVEVPESASAQERLLALTGRNL